MGIEDHNVEKLIHKAREGDHLCIEALLAYYSGRLTQFAKQEFTESAHVEIEAVLDLAFTKAWQNISSFEGTTDQSFFAWLKEIFRRELVNTLRPLKTLKRGHQFAIQSQIEASGSFVELVAELSADSRTPSSQARLAEQCEIVRTNLEKLAPEDRMVLRSHFLEDQPLSQIAETMGVSVGSVKHKIRRAKASLRELCSQLESSNDESRHQRDQ